MSAEEIRGLFRRQTDTPAYKFEQIIGMLRDKKFRQTTVDVMVSTTGVSGEVYIRRKLAKLDFIEIDGDVVRLKKRK